MREQGIERRPVVLKPATPTAHTETHLTGLRRDLEFIEKRYEVRIGPIVEDNESGIDGELLIAIRDFDRVYVSADAVIGFEHGDFVLVVQPMGNNVTGDAGSDYRDLHDVRAIRAEVADRL